MASIAERVAMDIVGNVGHNVTQLALKHGASPTYADNGNIQKTKAFQAIISKFRDKTTKQLMKHVKRSADELVGRDLSNVNYDKLISGIDTGIKNVQLLSGGSTDNIQVIQWEK